MLKKLYPNEYFPSVFHINYDSLFNKGIRNIIFDIDNTLVPFNVSSPTNEVIRLFADLKNRGFFMCILSNNNERRVSTFTKGLPSAYIHKAGKPGKKGILRALSLLSGTPQNTIIIGDQIFTDVICGNRVGIYSILVEPVSRENDQLSTRIKRGAEAFVVKRYLKDDSNACH